ncbi:MAG: phosphate/phosphite/phosphonate ABC transporter substrate-binding protein [Alphaproteobacteria bacterium]|nr:phosphate/phosphite/phosphonate ABC transporter substrate-binding protein [Alphaproteobacteria bacterium]
MESKDRTRLGRTDGLTSSFRRLGEPALLMLLVLPALAALLFVAILFWPASKETPDVLRVGVLPDQSPEMLEQRFLPLLDYLGAEIGMPFQLVVPGDYAALLDMFQRHEIDIAYFGGLTYLKAHDTGNARALVMRDVDTRFRSSFLARPDRPETTITDFRGKTLAFGSRLSTSGHLMPRHFLRQRNIEPESWFASIVYSGAHDETAMLVRDGKVDLGVVNTEILESMFRDGRLRRDEVRVVDQTPPYTDYVWAMRVGIDAGLHDRVVFAFLKLSPAEAEDAAILTNLGAGGFLPAPESEFGSLRKIAMSLGLLG